MTVYGLIALVIVLLGMALLLRCVLAAPARDILDDQARAIEENRKEREMRRERKKRKKQKRGGGYDGGAAD